MMINIEKLVALEHYKPIRTDSGFAERNDNYIEYTSKSDRYENLSPREYLNVIRSRNLINNHKPLMELNNNNTLNNNSNNNNNSSSNRAEWKNQLIMKNNFISVKDFEDARTIYSASRPVENFMGSDTGNIIDMLFSTI